MRMRIDDAQCYNSNTGFPVFESIQSAILVFAQLFIVLKLTAVALNDVDLLQSFNEC